MKKFLLGLILLSLLLTSCSLKRYSNASSIISDLKIGSLGGLANLIGSDKQTVLKILGEDYKIEPVGITKKDTGYYYEKYNVYIYFNGFSKLQYVEYDGKCNIFEKEIGSDFDSIIKSFGNSETEEYEIQDDGLIHEYWVGDVNLYGLSYNYNDFVLSFVSDNKTGKNLKTIIYKPNGFLKIDSMVDLLRKDFNEISKLFGNDFIMSAPTEELFPSWNYYKALGLYFGKNADWWVENEKYIELDKNISLNGVRSGMAFNEIMKVLGKTRIIEEERYMPEYKRYKIEYRYGDYFISFSSDDNLGTESQYEIALTNPNYKVRMFDNLDWKFTKDKIILIYDGIEYPLNIHLVSEAFPIYVEEDYKSFNIPDNALGACRFSMIGPGDVESFYVAKENENELVVFQSVFDPDKYPGENNDSPYEECMRIKTN